MLDHTSLIVAAFKGDRLVGIARAMFDGLSAAIMEISLGLEYQGDEGRYANGSLVEADPEGLGEKLGQRLLAELTTLGAAFINVYIVEGAEDPFYESLGFQLNRGHLAYYIEKRPYVEQC